ncbi:MAG: NAD(P)H-dependent oxidoreductase subunit E [Clostridia bacterium]|nr:NAD(P)H-dependent oxidoreductase subunit E [Clostridia bacterium]
MNKCEDVRFTELKKRIDKIKHKKGAPIICLQEAQTIFGYLCFEILEFISIEIKISVQKLYEVASYYPQFKLSLPAKHKISVCLGTACYVRGAGEVLDSVKRVLGICEGESSKDDYFSLDTVRCLGCCSLAPVMMIDEQFFPNVQAEKVEKIIRDFKDSHPS